MIATQLSFIAPGDGTPDALQILRDAQAVEPPVSRLRQHGAGSLALDELYQLILGVDDPLLAARVVARWTTIDELAHADSLEVEALPGMTPARATRLLAAAELTRRMPALGAARPAVKSPKDIVPHLEPLMVGLTHEIFVVVLLDTKLKIKGIRELYQGNVNTTVIRTAEVFRHAVIASVPTIVVAHNHPSQDPNPSPDDIAVTRELVDAGKIFDIELLDHLIIGGRHTYCSLKERGVGGL